MKPIDDGGNSAAVAEEFITSIVVPIIPDADAYNGRMFTLTVPDDEAKEGGYILAFTEATGRKIERWMDKQKVGKDGDQYVIHLEDNGCVRIGVRRAR